MKYFSVQWYAELDMVVNLRVKMKKHVWKKEAEKEILMYEKICRILDNQRSSVHLNNNSLIENRISTS